MFFGVGGYALQQLTTKVQVRHLTTTEPQSDFHFVAVFQELKDVTHFHIVVIVVSVRTELDLFDLDDFLLFTRFVFAFLRLVFELTKVHNLTNRRIGIW